MADDDIKAILDDLMARRGNGPDFIHELEGYVEDLSQGELDHADKKYIRELAKRLSGDGGGKPIKPDDEGKDDEDEDGEDEDDAGEAFEDPSADTRFERARQVFRDRFHPDNLDPDHPDAALRRELYEEFSAELDRIEDEG